MFTHIYIHRNDHLSCHGGSKFSFESKNPLGRTPITCFYLTFESRDSTQESSQVRFYDMSIFFGFDSLWIKPVSLHMCFIDCLFIFSSFPYRTTYYYPWPIFRTLLKCSFKFSNTANWVQAQLRIICLSIHTCSFFSNEQICFGFFWRVPQKQNKISVLDLDRKKIRWPKKSDVSDKAKFYIRRNWCN